MSIELARRIKVLEGKVAELEKQKPALPPLPDIPKTKMCPHCSAVPAYHFHVKNCQKKMNKKYGDDGIGTTGTT
jgi:hypothetical protein